MALIWKIRRFEALSTIELYEVLKLREEVFIIEQNCIYQDVDGKDAKALHLFGEYEGEVVAYSRLFKPGDYFDEASIGRVVVKQKFRDRKWGHDLMRESIMAINQYFNENNITISAQAYLEKFYNAHGFTAIGEGYLEDDIPHIRMISKRD